MNRSDSRKNAAARQHIVYVALGSNLSEREARGIVAEACRRVGTLAVGEVLASEAVATAAIGFSEPCVFVNQLLRFATYLAPSDLTQACKLIEQELGRLPSDKAHNLVRIDIDVVAVDGEVLRPEQAAWPHVAEAMAELEQAAEAAGGGRC